MIFPDALLDHEYQAYVCGEIRSMKLSDIKTRNIVLIFYPLDFTFVCPTEIIKLSELHTEFEELDTTVVFVSGDSVYSHKAWCCLPRDQGGIGAVKWPMVSDICCKLSRQLGLYNESTGTVVRSTVILDRDLHVHSVSATRDPIGRSSSEILRILRAIQYHEKYGEICPIDFETKSSEVSFTRK